MQDHLKNMSVDPTFVVKHQLAKTVLGMAAGFLVSVAYNKTVVEPELQKIYDERNK